ncbi:MAG: class I SAM-dependent methyltransferase, partial [Actinomycetota bacterium]|nr:class I SAM-dependent methyltransferase [Actinomycetota bacterium]
MLTIDFDRLELQEGHMVLDLGCGFGRHAFEALRRGAQVVACDMALPELH